MLYTREEKDWIEAEWAYHLHGRSAFLSREDFARLQAWEAEGVPTDALVGAMETYFARRAKRPRPRSFVALSHLEKDVAKAMKLREVLQRSGAEPALVEGWDSVKEPLHSDPRARGLYEAWRRLQTAPPLPDSPAFLDHHDAERAAFRAFVEVAEATLGPASESLRLDLRGRLLASKLQEDTPVWRLAWDHHWSRAVCQAWDIAP
jgi:hypothetical protein